MGDLARLIGGALSRLTVFRNSEDYWIKRYRRGGNSGRGSYGAFAEFKSTVLNEFVSQHDVKTVIEYGCGDGNQLTYLHFPSYIGFDVSPEALDQCRELFGNDDSKSFYLVGDYSGQKADLTLSLDVLFHLVEDKTFSEYVRRLFDSASKYVIIYSTNFEDINVGGPHVKHRNFTRWVAENVPDFKLLRKVENPLPKSPDSRSADTDFFIYARN